MAKGVKNTERKPAGPNLFAVLKPYKGLIALLIGLTIASSALNLVVPQVIAYAIDNFAQNNFILTTVIWEFFLVAMSIFIFTYYHDCKT